MLRADKRASLAVPDDFEIHSRLRWNLKARLATPEKGKGFDCTTAEAFAFGSLMREGVDVRISGQDAGRGTFSQRCVCSGLVGTVVSDWLFIALCRHAVLVGQKTEGIVVSLNLASDCKGRLELANSSLSEVLRVWYRKIALLFR